MDPRHPELAISRIDELMERYKGILAKMGECTLSSRLGGLEREGGLVVQEICLVAPRLHEAMVQVSRQRRHDIARGILVEPQDTAVEEPEEEPVEEPAEPEIDETTIEEPATDEPVEPEDAPALEPVAELPAEPVEQSVEQEVISEMETTTATEEPSATCSKTEQVEPVKEKKPKQAAKKPTEKAKK
jgi:hypothetical protein